jgi:uncharacterized protein YyaL (SSP411 family)
VPANRLINEKSPYLLQHAHNPVDWYAWGEEAFEKARREDKPIFLSVGYSTCHWCHVMERESFENESTAELLNANFVPVKVDREERPDVDRIYMLFVQSATGSGGWPMSVWLTPEGKPFYGGTYFPPDNRYGRPGFGAVLESLARAWKTDRARVEESGAKVVEQLRGAPEPRAAGAFAKQDLEHTFFTFRRMFDTRLGGFGSAPKFPRPSIYNFLLRYHALTKNEEALEMTLATLRAMAKGGMHDQLGGGFHRYSVDEQWFVPHFEKMLYDQAQLAVSYLEAFQITRDAQYAQVARDIFEYVLRDLAHRDGGFYSAEDADSATDPLHPHDKSEGAFYIWSAAEIGAALGLDDAALFAYRYGVEERGNVSEDPHGEFTGRNILYQAHTLEKTASHAGLAPEAAEQRLELAVKSLLAARAERPRPHLDDKVLAGWNGMMISAFAKGAQILGEERYLEAARRAADFLQQNLWREADATLLRRYRDGEAAVAAFLDDYALVAAGLLDLYETSFERRDLEWAQRLAERALELFEDREQGGFFSTREGSSDLVLRLKDDYDGAEPSGNSSLAMVLLRLARMRDREDFRTAAERALAASAPRMRDAGAAIPQMLVAQIFALGASREIVLAGPDTGGLLHVVRSRFLPDAVVMRGEDTPQPMPAVEDRATAYVCENFSCQLPVGSARELEALLGTG